MNIEENPVVEAQQEIPAAFVKTVEVPEQPTIPQPVSIDTAGDEPVHIAKRGLSSLDGDEVELLEDLVGEAYTKLAKYGEDFPSKWVNAIAYVLQKRTNPYVTIEQIKKNNYIDNLMSMTGADPKDES